MTPRIAAQIGPESGGQPEFGIVGRQAGLPPELPPELAHLRRRVMRSANIAVDMVEASLDALWQVDHAVARSIRGRDDTIDAEEIVIERECLRLLSERPMMGHDFRLATFCMRINADIERVADHATSIAKVSMTLDPDEPPQWPTALVELGDRVPPLCHELLRAVLDEDTEAARGLVDGDRIIDKMDRCLFDELTAKIERNADHAGEALLLFRVGRELERIGDLVASMAEHVVYLVSGEIIRHQPRRRARSSIHRAPGLEPGGQEAPSPKPDPGTATG